MDPPSYTQGDTLSLERVGNGYSLTEHDGTHADGTVDDTAHAYMHMVTLNTDGTLKVTEEHNGHREWQLTRTSDFTAAGAAYCKIGITNDGPGKTWSWSDGRR